MFIGFFTGIRLLVFHSSSPLCQSAASVLISYATKKVDFFGEELFICLSWLFSCFSRIPREWWSAYSLYISSGNLIDFYWRPTKFRPRKLSGLEMSVWKFPRTYLRDVSLMVKKGVVFRKVLKYSFWANWSMFFHGFSFTRTPVIDFKLFYQE